MEYFNLLPEDITLDIISRVPAESVLECKLVCTNWRYLVRHPSFSKMHLDHLNHPASDYGKLDFIAFTSSDWWTNYSFRYFKYDENHESIERIRRLNVNIPFGWGTRFLGPCNGLICCHSSENIWICNPINREYIRLPEIKRVGMGVWGSGFGYVSSTNEYKVVRIIFENEFKFEKDTEFMEVHVYTLGSGKGWRNLGKFNLGTGEYLGGGIFFNGVLYWLNNVLKMIFPFDLAEEKFRDHLSPPPSPLEYDFDYDSKLWVLDGCLSFVISGRVNEAECSDVWLLRNRDDNHGMIEQEGHQSIGWSEVFRVFDREIFAVTKSYSVLTHKGYHINIHDPKASTSDTIVVFEEHIGVVFPHKNTFVSLKELGEEDTKRMESVEIEETEGHAQPFNQL